MTLPFLRDDLVTVNRIPNVWSMSESHDSIELGISNGDGLSHGIDQIAEIFSVNCKELFGCF